jgi:xylanolytic transcriptional activator XlnR
VGTAGPPTRISGTSFFEYFLPLMVILGDVIELHHGRQHPRLFSFCTDGIRSRIEQSISTCEASLVDLASEDDMFDADSQNRATNVQLVAAYCTHILHVLHILLYSQWDPIGMLDNDDGWIATQDFSKCASHAIAASEAVSRILEFDPELAFMPYLFGIYLLQGSFILLLFADRMPQLGLNQSVAQACETIIRAHEVCIVTLSTEFQRSFRRAVRSTLYSVRGTSLDELEEYKLARRRVLSLYRWTRGARGLGI